MSTPTTLPLGTTVVVDQGTFGEWTGRTVVRTEADHDGDFCVARVGSEANNWTYIRASRLTVIEPPAEPDLDTRIEAARAALAALEEEKEAAERITLSLSRRDATVLREITAYISGTREGPRGASERITNALEDLGVQRDRRLVEPGRGYDIRMVEEWPTPLEPGASTW